MGEDASAGPVPDFVILGAPKSASTWLTAALGRHPQIFMPRDAVPFFEDAHYRADGIAEVSRLFARAPRGAVLGIRRSTYLTLEGVPGRLARHMPGARLIAILRQPADRAVSQHFHQQREGQIAMAAPDRAFACYLRGEFEAPYLRAKILESGLYAKALARYRQYFPPQQILVLTDIEIRYDPVAAYRRTCLFLGVTPLAGPRDLALRRNYGLYAPLLLRLASLLNRWRYRGDPLTGEVERKPGWRAELAAQAVLALQRGTYLASLLGLRQKPRVSAATRAALMEFYRDDIEQLERMLGIDLSPWRRT